MILNSAQNIPNIVIDTDGLFPDFVWCKGFVQIQAGIGGIWPFIYHPPEAEFYDTWRVHAGSQLQKQGFMDS